MFLDRRAAVNSFVLSFHHGHTCICFKAQPRRLRCPCVLPDAGCFSSCVIAANTLVALGAISVGEMTGQNEMCGEITEPQPVPSGLANYGPRLSIIRQRREQRVGQPVIQPWADAMDDNPAIPAWIAKLTEHRGGP